MYDGTFTFAMRAYTKRPDLGRGGRLDKVLFKNLAVAFERGFTRENRTAAEIGKILVNLHVQYVVFQSGYMSDDPEVHQLDPLLHSPVYTEVATISMQANYPFSPITALHVFRLKQDVPRAGQAPAANRTAWRQEDLSRIFPAYPYRADMRASATSVCACAKLGAMSRWCAG